MVKSDRFLCLRVDGPITGAGMGGGGVLMSGSLRYRKKKLAIRTCLAGSKNTFYRT